MGEAAYAAQYLQAPIYEENNPIEFDKLTFVKREDIADELEHPLIMQSWDTALTANTNSDYSAVTTWARVSDSNFILLNAKQMKGGGGGGDGETRRRRRRQDGSRRDS